MADIVYPNPDSWPPPRIFIRPWVDPLVDEAGHDPRSRYVERFWLGVLGPTATWLMRRLVAELEHSPDGYDVDLAETARSMGLAYTPGKTSPFAKALQRCVMFGLAHQTADGMAIRRRVPAVAHRHLRRMPEQVQSEHITWTTSTGGLDDLSRAHRLAVVMAETGDDVDAIEYHLIALGVPDTVSADVTDNLRQLAADRFGEADELG